MNAREFLDAINRQAPLHLRHADLEFLGRYEIALGRSPYYSYDIPKAISLLRNEYEFLGKLKQTPKGGLQLETKAPVAISQVVVIHNSDPAQCYRIWLGLIQTGLINFEGPVFVNFSPFTNRLVDSLPSDAFNEVEYYMEYADLEQEITEGKRKPLGRVVQPVLFTKDVEPTLVQLSFVSGGRRYPELGRGAPLPSPLYQAFLNVNAGSSQEIIDFMSRYKVYLFWMWWDRQQLSRYIAGVDTSMQLQLPMTEGRLKQFWAGEQQNMRGVIGAAAQGSLPQVVFPQVFPLYEEAIVEWGRISGYFNEGLPPNQIPEDVRLALLEFKEDETLERRVHIRRYYGWLSYMWAELADDIYKGTAALACERCGRVISRGEHGRPKRFCGLKENPQCYKARKAEQTAGRRKRAKL